MHPTVAYKISKARIADWQRRAGQDALARAARSAHRTPPPRRPRLAAALAGRVLMLPGARGRAAQARLRAQAACSPSAPCTSCV